MLQSIAPFRGQEIRDFLIPGCNCTYRVDRNLALYVPRLTVLVSIEADRPEGWFPGLLDLYLTSIPAIYLSRDFDLVKVPENPMESPFDFGVFLGVKLKKNLFLTVYSRMA